MQDQTDFLETLHSSGVGLRTHVVTVGLHDSGVNKHDLVALRWLTDKHAAQSVLGDDEQAMFKQKVCGNTT